MVVITVKMNARPAKRQELLQTIHELAEVKRKEKGFIGSRLCMDAENKNVLTLIEEWKTQADVDSYTRSDYFSVLRGALKFLAESSEIKFSMGGKPYENIDCRIGAFEFEFDGS